MGTRSRIAIREDNGTIRSIYCHWDGYPAGVGRTLLESYCSVEKLGELMDRGDRSDLGASPEEGSAYADRGEDVPALMSAGLPELNKIDCGEEYVYLYEPAEDRWFFTRAHNKDWRELTLAACED